MNKLISEILNAHLAIDKARRKILTHPVFPPISIRGLDWCATYDNYEPGQPIGHGDTEEEAIADLLEQDEGREPSDEWQSTGNGWDAADHADWMDNQ